MSRNAVVTISVGHKWDSLGQVTANTMASYAHRINADFVIVSNNILPGLGCREYEKFQLYDLLDVYDRVMLLDYDAIILKDCPDVFKIVPEDKLGVATHHLIQGRTQDVIDQFGDTKTDWNGESPYWDSGVIVASRVHRDIFEYKTQPRLTKVACAEERTFNYRIYKHKIPVFDIGHRFHFLLGRDRYVDPFIIHWAGGGRGGGLKVLAKAERIKSDIENFEAWKEAGFPKQWE